MFIDEEDAETATTSMQTPTVATSNPDAGKAEEGEEEEEVTLLQRGGEQAAEEKEKEEAAAEEGKTSE